MQEVLSCMIESARTTVSYYSNLYNPELKEHSGLSVSERLSMAQEHFDSLLTDARDYSHWWENGNCFFEGPAEEIASHLKTIIGRNMREAYAFAGQNPYIVYRRFKAAVTALNLLRQIDPQYEAVTPRFFIH